jgi:carbonic anhydrase
VHKLVVAALLSLLAAVPLHAADPEDAKCATFGYEPDNGPDAWGLMRPEWIACDSGKAQSPIVLDLMTPSSLPQVGVGPEHGPFTIQNTGHEYKIFPLYTALFWRGADSAKLVQFHFHHPAEHYTSIKDRAAMEMHAVYQLHDKSALALGVFFVEDKDAQPNAELQKVIDAKFELPACRSRKTPETMQFDLGKLFPNPIRHYVTYGGSLTTPPCTEPVTFILALDPVRLPPSQIKALRVGGHDNVRPPQPRLGRRVLVQRPTK